MTVIYNPDTVDILRKLSAIHHETLLAFRLSIGVVESLEPEEREDALDRIACAVKIASQTAPELEALVYQTEMGREQYVPIDGTRYTPVREVRNVNGHPRAVAPDPFVTADVSEDQLREWLKGAVKRARRQLKDAERDWSYQ